MLADARSIDRFATFVATAVEIDEARVEVPATRHGVRRKSATHALLDLRDQPREHRRKRLSGDRAIARAFRRLVVAKTRELPVAEPVHWAEQASLLLAGRGRALRRVPHLPERVQLGEPREDLVARFRVDEVGLVDVTAVDHDEFARTLARNSGGEAPISPHGPILVVSSAVRRVQRALRGSAMRRVSVVAGRARRDARA